MKECRSKTAAAFEGLTCDVSSNNGVIDWDKAYADGFRNAIIRSTMGGAGVDTAFVANVQQAVAAGFRVGYYHFFRPDSTGEKQAENFLRTVSGKTTPFWLAVDVEPPSDGASTTKADYAAKLAEFVRYIRDETGELPVIYTSQSMWEELVGTAEDALFAQCRLWVANYTLNEDPALPRCWTEWILWQYTSTYAVDWTQNKRVDMNRWNKSVPVQKPLYINPAKFLHVVSGHFNDARNYPFAPNRLQLHEGVDFAPKAGAVAPHHVVAPRAGSVVKVGFDPRGYGNYLIIDHGDTMLSWLAHLAEPPLVQSGWVEQGQLVGYAGNTGGTSTGVHLHWTLQDIPEGLDNYVVRDVVDPETRLDS